MKTTDYAARSAPFDHHLLMNHPTDRGLLCAEFGVDAGAHAEAMLRTGIIRSLHLVDPWGKGQAFQKGMCAGRLNALGFHGYYTQHEMTAQQYSQWAAKGVYDGVYCDLPQDVETARDVLPFVWDMLVTGGILGYRNYCEKWTETKDFIDRFFMSRPVRMIVESYANELVVVKL